MTKHFEWGRSTKGSLPGSEHWWTILAVMVALSAGIAVGMYHLYTDNSGLQQWYLRAYVGSIFAQSRHIHGNGNGQYQVLDLIDDRQPDLILSRLTEDDATVALGKNNHLDLHYTEKWPHYQHLRVITNTITSDNSQMHAWLQQHIYHGDGILDLLQWPARMGTFAAGILLILGLYFAVPADKRRADMRRDGRRVRGTQLLNTFEFNRSFHTDGIGWINEADFSILPMASPLIRVPKKAEANHFLAVGASGSGKTVLIEDALWQIQDRGQSAIVFDPDGRYTSHFYTPARGDVILNPLDARSAYWHPGDEVRNMAEGLVVAGAFFPTTPAASSTSQDFFSDGAKQVLARLLTYNPTPEELTQWLSNPCEISRRLAGTPQAQILSEAPGQRAGILGALSKGANSFSLLLNSDEANALGKPNWNSRQWADNPTGWVFLTSRAEMHDAIRPLISTWIDLCILRLLSRLPDDRIPVWCILDELSYLNYLPMLHTGLTQARRFNLRFVLGCQDVEQLTSRLGSDAHTIVGMPKTKIYLRAGDSKSAEWASKNLGEVEVERISETWTYGERRTRSESIHKSIEKLVLPSELMCLPDRHGYLQHEGHVVPINFPYREIPVIANPYIERKLPKQSLSVPVVLQQAEPSAAAETNLEQLQFFK